MKDMYVPQSRTLQEKYVVTTNALWRAVQFMLRRLVKEGRLRDPTVICCAKVGGHRTERGIVYIIEAIVGSRQRKQFDAQYVGNLPLL